MIKFQYTRDWYGWLHNFSDHKCEYNGILFPTSEAAYQWQKINPTKLTPEEYQSLLEEFLVEKHPRLSKTFVKNVDHLWFDFWDDMKIVVMSDVLVAKLRTNPDLVKKLKRTGDEEIVEISKFDTFWGMLPDLSAGENHLGKLWMKIRENLVV